MKVIKSYAIVYISFIISAMPWIITKAWNQRGIPGGVNEALEGLVLYLGIAVLPSLVFTLIIYIFSRFEKSILNTKILIPVSLIVGTILLYGITKVL